MLSTEQRPDSRDNPVTSHSLLNVARQKQGLVLVVLQSGYGLCTCLVQPSSSGPQLEKETFDDLSLHRLDSLFLYPEHAPGVVLL